MAATKIFEKLIPATEPTDARVFYGSVAYSLFHLALMWHAYLTGFYDPPYSLIVVHSIFVGLLYALPKEYDRWSNHKKSPAPNRPGHLLVIAWILSHTLMNLLAYLTKGKYGLPEGMTDMTGILFGTFCLTYFSKRMHLNKVKCPPTETEGDETKPAP